MKAKEFRILTVIAVAGVIAIAVLALTLVPAPQAARSDNVPEWSGFAGYANHACYSHRGVRQLFGPTGGGFGSPSEVDVVCADGWAVNLNDDTGGKFPLGNG